MASTGIYLLTALNPLEIQDQDVSRFDFFWVLSPWLANALLLTLSSGTHLSLQCAQISSPMTPVILITSCKPFQYRHILRFWGLGIQPVGLGGNIFQSITPPVNPYLIFIPLFSICTILCSLGIHDFVKEHMTKFTTSALVKRTAVLTIGTWLCNRSRALFHLCKTKAL